MITLTFGGSARVMPNYNVMGVAKAALEASVRYLPPTSARRNIRVNSISAGPVRTLAGAGIGDCPHDVRISAKAFAAGRWRDARRTRRLGAVSAVRSVERRHRRNPLSSILATTSSRCRGREDVERSSNTAEAAK